MFCCLFSCQDEVFKKEEFLESGGKINKKEGIKPADESFRL